MKTSWSVWPKRALALNESAPNAPAALALLAPDWRTFENAETRKDITSPAALKKAGDLSLVIRTAREAGYDVSTAQIIQGAPDKIRGKIFFTEQGFILTIFKHEAFRSYFEREMAGRAYASGIVRTPALIEISVEQMIMKEEYIAGPAISTLSAQKNEDAFAEIAPQLRIMYSRGMSSISATDFADGCLKTAERFLEREHRVQHMARPLMDAASACVRALDKEPVRVTNVHGDFAPDNIIAANHTPYLVDWERFRPAPAEYDLFVLLYKANKTLNPEALIEIWEMTSPDFSRQYRFIQAACLLDLLRFQLKHRYREDLPLNTGFLNKWLKMAASLQPAACSAKMHRREPTCLPS